MREPARLVMLAAGGTGGHLFPAEALAAALRALEVRVVLATDARTAALAGTFPAERVVEIPSATPSGGSPLSKAAAAFRLGRGVLRSLAELRRERPACVVGFGGYPTVPPVFAASTLRIPTVIHEQNGVIGRANRFLLPRASAIATGFPSVGGLPPEAEARRYHTGNPLRPAVIAAARTPFDEPRPDGTLRLLVFGGSQGARVMSEVVPAALERLRPSERARIVLTQQARPEDVERLRAAYSAAGLAAEVAPFFADLPARMAAAHLVVSRSGASTVAELAAIGRPAVLVPLPGALDQDQAANARSLAAIDAATVLPQAEFTPDRLSAEIAASLADPARLTARAAAAKSAGVLDAAERLASLVLSLAKLPVPEPGISAAPAGGPPAPAGQPAVPASRQADPSDRSSP